MTLEEAQRIWKGYDMDLKTLEEWVWIVNNRPPDPPDAHLGETVEVLTPAGLEPATSSFHSQS